MKSVGKVVMNNFQDSDIEFDNKNNYFCFKNCAIDLDTGKEVNINREDYITINTGYNKVKSTKEQRNVLEEMMSKIFPDKEELQSFYTLLKVTLYGEQDKQFHVLRGNGSNGKGLVCEHFEKVMGNYYYKPNKEFLLNKLSDGVSEILSNMDRKRLINFTELAKDDKIRPEIIKVLTDAPTTTARGIYEKSHIIHLLASIWIDTNPEIKILGDVDYSIERRFVYWYFRSTFVDNEKYLTRADNIYMKESKFKDTTFVRNNRSTWIDLILEKKHLYFRQIYMTLNIIHLILEG
jgi:phage/plasmid-associated DNA primase